MSEHEPSFDAERETSETEREQQIAELQAGLPPLDTPYSPWQPGMGHDELMTRLTEEPLYPILTATDLPIIADEVNKIGLSVHEVSQAMQKLYEAAGQPKTAGDKHKEAKTEPWHNLVTDILHLITTSRYLERAQAGDISGYPVFDPKRLTGKPEHDIALKQSIPLEERHGLQFNIPSTIIMAAQRGKMDALLEQSEEVIRLRHGKSQAERINYLEQKLAVEKAYVERLVDDINSTA